MSYAPNGKTRPTTDAEGARRHGHPRGRGFTILSRLAREQAAPEAPTVASQPAVDVAPEPAPETAAAQAPADTSEWRAPVVPLERAQPEPRHRRDVDVETEDFEVSAVPVARRSS